MHNLAQCERLDIDLAENSATSSLSNALSRLLPVTRTQSFLQMSAGVRALKACDVFSRSKAVMPNGTF